MPEVVSLQSSTREAEMRAWGGAAERAMAELPPLSLTLQGLVPTRHGLSYAAYPSADYGPVREAVLRASPCWEGAGSARGYEVPLLCWTDPLSREELEGFMAAVARFEDCVFGTALPHTWHVGYTTLNNRPPFTKSVHSWKAKAQV